MSSEWASTTLKEAAGELFTDGDWVESKDQDPDGEVRLIQLADIGDGSFLDKSARFLTAEKARELRCTFLQPGDLLIARMADPIARCCIFPGISQPAATVVDVSIVRPGPDVDREYLAYAVSSPVFRSEALGSASGTTRSRISRSNLGAISLPLPPLDEQRRIAEVLRSVDEAIAAAGHVISGLERAASEIAGRAFADPDAVEPDCEVVTFGDLFDIKGGNQPPKSSFVYQPRDGYVRLLQIRDFESDDKAAYITETSTKARCAEDDILIARYGASVGRILTGKAGAYNVALTKIVFRDDRITRRYAYHWLKSEYFQDRIRAVSNRSAQAGFNKEDLFPTKIALPTMEAQRDIAEALDDIEKAVWANRNQREQLIELKSALLDDLLSGRVRVPA